LNITIGTHTHLVQMTLEINESENLGKMKCREVKVVLLCPISSPINCKNVFA